MAKHEITIHENQGVTKEAAPFLGTYQSKGTININDKYDEMSALSGLPKIQLQTILEGAFAAFADMEQVEPTRIYTDLGQICAKIGGTFDTADGAFDVTRNSFDLVLHLADDVKLDLVNVTPSIVTDETITRVQVNNIMDKEVNKPLNLIHGRGVFRVAGYNLCMDDEGAACYLLSENGTVYPCTITTQISNQLFEARSNSLLEGGDYKFVVKSRGGDEGGVLQTVFRKVKYLKVAPHMPTPSVNIAMGYKASFAGTGAAAATDLLKLADMSNEAHRKVWYKYGDMADYVMKEGDLMTEEGVTTLDCDIAEPGQEIPSGTTVYLKVQVDPANGTYVSEFIEMTKVVS